MKLDTKRRSVLFERHEEIVLKGVFSKLKISDELSAALPLLSYLGITYKKNEVVKDVLEWFTSHDLSTMNREVFRRDEIWFAAKGNAPTEIAPVIKVYELARINIEK